mgnify:CR=1 FL=1
MKLMSRRAVSTVVATVIMINIAVVLGITAYVYSQNILGTMTSNYDIVLQRNKERLGERISIVNIRFRDDTTCMLNISVLNTGSRHVEIDAIYLNGTSILHDVYAIWNNTGVPPGSIPSPDDRYLVVTEDGMTFGFDDQAPIISEIRYGCVQSIAVVTTNGIKTNEEWLATEGV